MGPDRTFRRNFLVIAVLHVIAVVIVYFVSTLQHKTPADQVIWLDGGSIGGGETGAGEAAPQPTQVSSQPPPTTEPPIPDNPPELVSVPPVKQTPSEIVTPDSTPAPATPKPSTPKPETPKPQTPKPTTPKPTPKPTPKHSPTPKPKPKPKPATPKPASDEDRDDDATPKPKPSPAAKRKGSPGVLKTEGASATTSSKNNGATGGNGVGSGNGKGPGKTGNGSGTSEFGWYFSMIHDRFHSRWDQPTSLSHAGQDIVTTVKIRISKDGVIQNREIVHSSGDTTMDQSVMTAAERVHEIDPLPAGLGNGEFFEINIAFKLDQGQ